MTASIRIAVVGAGAWGLNHVRVLASEPRCRLVAVVDPDPSSRDRVRAFAPDVAWHGDVQALLAREVIDAVVIASPAETHARLTTPLLEAHKHVLVEKPLTLSLREARALRARARASRVVAMVGHLMLFHPAVARIRELIRAGVLGAPRLLHSTRVNLGRHRDHENVLWSFGPHDLSMFDFLLDASPSSVAARGHSVLKHGVEDVVFLTLRYASGAMAHVHLSWLHPRKERRLTVVGADKMVEFDDVGPDKLRIYDRGPEHAPQFTEFSHYLTIPGAPFHVPPIPMCEPLQAELGHFLGCIIEGTQPIADLDSAVRVTAVLDAAQRSLALDGAPLVPDLEDP